MLLKGGLPAPNSEWLLARTAGLAGHTLLALSLAVLTSGFSMLGCHKVLRAPEARLSKEASPLGHSRLQGAKAGV